MGRVINLGMLVFALTVFCGFLLFLVVVAWHAGDKFVAFLFLLIAIMLLVGKSHQWYIGKGFRDGPL